MLMKQNVALLLARANKAAQRLAEAGTEAEAAAYLEAGLGALDAALAAASPDIAERVQVIATEITDRLLAGVRVEALEAAVTAAQAA
jgi:hypothetical protein